LPSSRAPSQRSTTRRGSCVGRASASPACRSAS